MPAEMRAQMTEGDSPPFRSAEPMLSMSETAYRRIRKAIELGQLQPRARLREDDLAQWLEMSRTPVREAVRRMEAEGFFTRESRSLVVASLDQQSVVELYAMREVLEGTAAAFAAQQASPVEVATLRELCDIEARILGQHDDIVRHNERFHLAVYGAAHNKYLLKSLAALRDTRMLLGPTTLSSDARIRSAYEEHLAIVGAIERRDAATAEAVAREHIKSAARERLRTIGS